MSPQSKNFLKNSAGFSPVIIILIIAAITILGVVMWRVYDASQSEPEGSGSADSVQQSQQPEANTHQPSPTSTDSNAGYVVIKEWGVRFKPVEGLSEVVYFKPSNLESDVFTFTTNTLAHASTACSKASDTIVLGLITRTTQSNPAYGGILAKIGEHYYQYRGPQAACSTGDTLQTENETVLKLSQSLNSLEAVK